MTGSTPEQIRKGMMEAIADADAERRQKARIVHHLRKRNLHLIRVGSSYSAACRATMMQTGPTGTLDRMEAWAKA